MEFKIKQKMVDNIFITLAVTLLLFSATMVSGQNDVRTICDSDDVVAQWNQIIDTIIVSDDVCEVGSNYDNDDNGGLCLIE